MLHYLALSQLRGRFSLHTKSTVLELPHAEYHFATFKDEQGIAKNCVISLKFLEVNEEFRPGNEFIEGFDSSNNKFKNSTHPLDAILQP